MPRAATETQASRPLVTILTVARNSLDGLKQTVESVRSQTFRDLEHVVVDGASTDGSREWLASLGNEVRWRSEPDDGIADALNKAVAMARGAYVLVLQAEDVFLSAESLQRAAPHLERDLDIVCFNVLLTRRSAEQTWISKGLSPRLEFKPFPHQGAFCRRGLFERLGPFDTTFHINMDYEFFLRARRAGASVRCVSEILSRMPATGVSSRLDWPSLRARFAEERRAQLKNCPGPGMRLVYAVYWPLYLSYRRVRSALFRVT